MESDTMLKSRLFAAFVAGLILIVAVMVLIDRGGLIAGGALFIGVVLLAKIWSRPSKRDLAFSVGLAAIPVLAWIGTFYYVISTYESGEVVELDIDTSNGIHTARVWVLDIGADPVVYYDADPEVAQSLLAGKPLQYTRAGKVSTRVPKATPLDALSEDQARLLFDAMATKYGDRVDAAAVFYLMLGRSRDQIALVIYLSEA